VVVLLPIDKEDTTVILDRPYVSDLLEDTLARLQTPVFLNHPDLALRNPVALALRDRESFFGEFAHTPHPRLYTNSEDALGDVLAHLGDTSLGRQIRVAKDKALMRELLQPLYPDLFFARVGLDELASLPSAGLPFPLIIKPAVGFFSVAVVSVDGPDGWDAARARVSVELEAARGVFPESVLNTTQMVLEQRVEGREFAIDTYFGSDGAPVLLDVMEHLFRDAEDTDDRVYVTSAALIREHGPQFVAVLGEMGHRLGFTNLAAHVEFRVEASGRAVPIEINPLRLAGFCSTDLAWYAYGLNTHETFLRGWAPDWERLLVGRDAVYSLVVCKPPQDLDRARIRDVDWDRLATTFSRPLEIRRMDYHAYPLLAFAFIESPDLEEPRRLLDADFAPFLQLD
jgi:hypothetical protein